MIRHGLTDWILTDWFPRPIIVKSSSRSTCLAGLLAARAARTSSGRTESNTGLRLESLFRSGTARPIIEALTTFHQDLRNIECAPGAQVTGFSSRMQGNRLRVRVFRGFFLLLEGSRHGVVGIAPRLLSKIECTLTVHAGPSFQ